MRRHQARPFCNQHVTLTAYPTTSARAAGGRGSIICWSECENDGWTALPTRGVRDYWAWNFDAWIKSAVCRPVYIDEANSRRSACGCFRAQAI